MTPAPADPPSARRVRVAHLGPDPRDGGGMPAVVAGLMQSPLAELHDLQVIPTHQLHISRRLSSSFWDAIAGTRCSPAT